MQHNMQNRDLDLGVCLTALYRLSRGQYGAQPEWFAHLWRSYHQACGDDQGIDYRTSQSRVCRIMGSKVGLPKGMYVYYVTHDDLLYQDIADYMHNTIRSDGQRREYMDALRGLVVRSRNLAAGDKAYILDYDSAAAIDQLVELAYRMMVVLIRQPVTKAA